MVTKRLPSIFALYHSPPQSRSFVHLLPFLPESRTSERLCHKRDVSTPYNVGSVLWRLFSTLEVVQYIGGITSVLWGDNFSTVEVVQYSGG